MQTLTLKKGKDKAVRQRHPWIFSGAVERLSGSAANGDVVAVANAAGEWLAYGYYNAQSRVAVRLLEWNPDNRIDELWWRQRIRQAAEARKFLHTEHTNAYRLIFSEADFLPGLIADRYGEYISVQLLTAGADNIKHIVVDELNRLYTPGGIFDRSDAGARAHDGLEPSYGLISGNEIPEYIEVSENGIRYHVNIAGGQKSGFYCDQRDNRLLTAEFAKGKRVLDCFCYTGGFTLNCLQKGAGEVISVDSSAPAIETLKRNLALNDLTQCMQHQVVNDVNRQLREFKSAGEKFDLIILDPPKFAPSRSSLDKALRAYKDLNRLALALLEHGGLLATFSCSGAVDGTAFKQTLAWAAMDAGKQIQFIHQYGQPPDHPVRASFPEGEYLKGLLCRVC